MRHRSRLELRRLFAEQEAAEGQSTCPDRTADQRSQEPGGNAQPDGDELGSQDRLAIWDCFATDFDARIREIAVREAAALGRPALPMCADQPDTSSPECLSESLVRPVRAASMDTEDPVPRLINEIFRLTSEQQDHEYEFVNGVWQTLYDISPDAVAISVESADDGRHGANYCIGLVRWLLEKESQGLLKICQSATCRRNAAIASRLLFGLSEWTFDDRAELSWYSEITMAATMCLIHSDSEVRERADSILERICDRRTHAGIEKIAVRLRQEIDKTAEGE